MKRYSLLIAIWITLALLKPVELFGWEYEEEPLFVAIVQSYKGDVTVKRRSARDWGKIRKGMILNEGCAVKTGFNSKLIIKVIRSGEKDFLVTIDENTEALLSQLVVDEILINRLKFNLDKGTTLIRLKDASKDTEVQVKTPNTIIEANKYGFIVKYPKKENEKR